MPPVVPPQKSDNRAAIVVVAVATVLIVVLGATVIFALWLLPRGDGHVVETASTPTRSLRPAASPNDTHSPSPAPTEPPDVSAKDIHADKLTARGWYGDDKSTSYSNGDTEATMHVKGTWDHDTCAGAGQSARGRNALDNGGCLYGIEIAMEHESGVFWIDQRVFAYRDQASAKAAQKLLEINDDEIARHMSFGIPEISANHAIGSADTFGRCLVIATAALDLAEVKERGERAFDKLQDQVVVVWTSVEVEPVSAYAFGAYRGACG
jgi:hypothetical protein